MPRLRNQDGIEKGISRLQLKLPTSISISAPIYSHRPYKRVCTYIGFSLYRPLLSRLLSSRHSFPLVPSRTSDVCVCVCDIHTQEDVTLPHDAKRPAVCSDQNARLFARFVIPYVRTIPQYTIFFSSRHVFTSIHSMLSNETMTKPNDSSQSQLPGFLFSRITHL